MQETSKCELYGEESCDCGYCNVEGWLTLPALLFKKGKMSDKTWIT